MKKIAIYLFVPLILFSCGQKDSEEDNVDVLFVGGGIMSITLASMLHELDPSLSMATYEKLDDVALESSGAFNNAGTGHAALCELNYTPELSDGTIDIKKAITVNEAFELSKEYWAYLVRNGKLSNPKTFINPVAHMSFVMGEKDVTFLKKRYEALIANPLYTGMEYSEDPKQLEKWIPLVMKDRKSSEKVAATKIDIGTDVNFEALTKALAKNLVESKAMTLSFNHQVQNFERNKDNTWKVIIKDLNTSKSKIVNTKFLFIGAGGATLPLLEKTKIPEARGYGGFPVSGEWLVCNNEEIIAQHAAKVYGKASVGSPPMSVPHLDTRVIDGKKQLLFGPFAGFSPKFLKEGKWSDLPESFNFYNLRPILEAGLDNVPLTQYLVEQVIMTPEQKLAVLQQYMPTAKMEDWDLRIAGQRVQVMKMDGSSGKGILQFGTEVVSAEDGSVAALLGASPGASTSVSIMLTVVEKCFANKMNTPEWQTKIRQMIPTYGTTMLSDLEVANRVRKENAEALGLVWKEININKQVTDSIKK